MDALFLKEEKVKGYSIKENIEAFIVMLFEVHQLSLFGYILGSALYP
jgi:hypothetical protein